MKSKVVIVLLLVALAAGQACADQIIFAPTGRTLGLGQAKIEGAFLGSDADTNVEWLNIGLPRVELQALRTANSNGSDDTGFGAELGILPETIVTPAVGVGVRDISNSTSVGRGVYLAASKTVPLAGSVGLPIKSLKLHAGLGTESFEGFFGGIELGLPANLTGYAEWDGESFNGAIGWSPITFVQIKGYWIDGDFYYGGRLSIGL